MDLTNPSSHKVIPELSKKVFDLVLEYGGSITAEHNDGLVRGAYLEQMYGKEVFKLFKEVKTIFDPKGIFNPHKKIDATFDYSWAHISKS
jgi:FAD/FMN-containing dehydrogenase